MKKISLLALSCMLPYFANADLVGNFTQVPGIQSGRVTEDLGYQNTGFCVYGNETDRSKSYLWCLDPTKVSPTLYPLFPGDIDSSAGSYADLTADEDTPPSPVYYTTRQHGNHFDVYIEIPDTRHSPARWNYVNIGEIPTTSQGQTAGVEAYYGKQMTLKGNTGANVFVAVNNYKYPSYNAIYYGNCVSNCDVPQNWDWDHVSTNIPQRSLFTYKKGSLLFQPTYKDSDDDNPVFAVPTKDFHGQFSVEYGSFPNHWHTTNAPVADPTHPMSGFNSFTRGLLNDPNNPGGDIGFTLDTWKAKFTDPEQRNRSCSYIQGISDQALFSADQWPVYADGSCVDSYTVDWKNQMLYYTDTGNPNTGTINVYAQKLQLNGGAPQAPVEIAHVDGLSKPIVTTMSLTTNDSDMDADPGQYMYLGTYGALITLHKSSSTGEWSVSSNYKLNDSADKVWFTDFNTMSGLTLAYASGSSMYATDDYGKDWSLINGNYYSIAGGTYITKIGYKQWSVDVATFNHGLSTGTITEAPDSTQ